MKLHILAALAGAGVCALAVAPASADTTTTTTAAAPAAPGYYVAPAPAAGSTTSTTTTHHDYEATTTNEDHTPRVHSGVGLDVLGVVGGTDESRLGVGGRLQFVFPFGLTLGGSFTQHFNTNGNNDIARTQVRPLLGEIGFAIPVAYNVEINPMVGIGYAWVDVNSNGNSSNNGQQTNSTTNVATSNFDVAPGVKISYIASGFEVFTQPKYHVIKDLNFFALEAGVGARF